jgi:hypothetical protein
MKSTYSNQFNVSSEVLIEALSYISHFGVVNDGKILHNRLIMI